MEQKYNILSADDDEDLVNLLSRELSNVGYNVSVAFDGAQAITLSTEKKFDLAILDIKMPKKDGLEVLKFIKENSPSTKVIMLTAYADVANALAAKRLGAEDFLEKPYDLGELLSTIERLL
jgi:DNA-binding NtrC family response regulator